MDSTPTDTTHTTGTDRRSEIGKLFAVMATVLAVITPLPALGTLGTTEFAQDFEMGTHTADHSGLYASGWMALATVICAALAAIIGRGGSRAVGLLLLAAPAVCLLALR